MLIAIAHQKGGCSKTTLSLNLAVELNASHCYDLDLAKGGTTGLTFLSKLRAHAGHPGLHVTPIHSKDELVQIIESDTDDQVLILDLGGLDSDLNRIAIAYADLLITPANDSALEVGGLSEFSRILNEISEQTKTDIVAHVIAARTNYARKHWPALSGICAQHENLVFSERPMPLYVDYADALGEGQGITEYRPKSNAAKYMRDIAKYIKSVLK